MADSTKRRARRSAKRAERQRRTAIARPLGPRHDGGTELPPPSWPDDLDGGAGVREPRRPFPGQPAGALELDVEPEQRVELVG